MLLMMGTDQAIDALRNSEDLVLFDRARVPSKAQSGKMALVVGVIAAVIGTAALDLVPIEVGAVAGCVIVCAARCLQTTEAYASIEWNILFLIYGMLAMGLAMEQSGAAAWIASGVVEGGTSFQMRSVGEDALSEKNSVPRLPTQTGPSMNAKYSDCGAAICWTEPMPAKGSP